MREFNPDPMREPIDIVTRLSQRAAELRPAERKVAQTVLSDIAEAATGSIQTLAERAGVSEASVTRFAKAMGCRDVRELKLKLAQAAAVGQRFLDGGADRPPSTSATCWKPIARWCGPRPSAPPPKHWPQPA